MIAFPATVKIGGHHFSITFPYTFTERNDRSGDICYESNQIRITNQSYDQPRSESAIVVTFIHEILHGIDHMNGYGIFGEDEGEKKISALSEGIYQVLVDNDFLKKEM